MSSSLTLEGILEQQPKLHPRGDEMVSWQLSDEVLSLLDAEVRPGWRTIETGEGISTLVFAMKGAMHTCVSPNTVAISGIKEFCARNDLSLETVRFEVGPSQDVLPRLELTGLDLALVDGGHGFPIPFIDWWYLAQGLKRGGLLVVDDIQLWTGHVLREFLESEPEWSLYRDFAPRSVVFRKEVDPIPYKEWTAQRFTIRQNDHLHHPSAIGRGMALLRQREFGEFRRRVLGLARRMRPGSRAV